jgi:acetyl-CoA C-acetyltransferase
MAPTDVVIAAAARTPFGAFGGSLRDRSIPDLASEAAVAALERAGVAPQEVDELVLGVNLPGSDRSLARQTQLKCGMPEERSSYTVDRACCSSLTAVSRARQSVLAGTGGIALAGGAENLSRVPYFVHEMRWGRRLGPIELLDQLVISCPYTHVPRAVQAAEEAKEFGVDRADQDRWALRSQQRAARAIDSGLLTGEIHPLAELDCDESPRPTTTLEKLTSLPTVNGSATVTAGNAPGLSTGAAMTVLMAESTAAERGIEPLARIIATAMASGPPERIASIPAVAAEKVLTSAGVTLQEVSLIEVNEAFAAVPLVTSLVLARRYDMDVSDVRERMNVNGGAIALGHPTGATGGRLLLTLALELRRRGGGLGLVTICGGIGEAESVLIDVDGGPLGPARETR